MSRVIVKNNTAKVLREYDGKVRTGIYRTGQAVLQGGGPRTPKKTGFLRRMTQVKQIGQKTVQVLWSARYAIVQNNGLRRGARPFKKYTTGGTGPGFAQVGIKYAKARAKGLMR